MPETTGKDRIQKTRGSFGESFLVAILSASGFMAWGLWVNWEYGMASRVQVALTQAGISFLATFGSAEMLRLIAKALAGVRCGSLLTAVTGWFTINGLVFLAHWIFGTPEIFQTMIPGLIAGVGFCFFYARRLGG